MTDRDTIVRMALSCGVSVRGYGNEPLAPGRDSIERFYRAAHAAGAAAEREACALTCESIARDTYGMVNLHEYGECASAIRARGQA